MKNSTVKEAWERTREEEKEFKRTLRPGDVIVFHAWFSGSILVGVVVDQKLDMDFWESEYSIWRPRGMYNLMEPSVDGVEIFRRFCDLGPHDSFLVGQILEVLQAAKENNIPFCFEDPIQLGWVKRNCPELLTSNR